MPTEHLECTNDAWMLVTFAELVSVGVPCCVTNGSLRLFWSSSSPVLVWQQLKFLDLPLRKVGKKAWTT
eukprot:g50040.t1